MHYDGIYAVISTGAKRTLHWPSGASVTELAAAGTLPPGAFPQKRRTSHPQKDLRVLWPPSSHGLKGFFCPMNRISFLVDGFNVYHSAKEARNDLGGVPTLCLDLRSLLRSYMSIFGREAALTEIYYFSALARHIDSKRPGTTKRHQDYIACLKSTSVKVRLGRFKYKEVWCSTCRSNNGHYEEKETDVALSLPTRGLPDDRSASQLTGNSGSVVGMLKDDLRIRDEQGDDRASRGEPLYRGLKSGGLSLVRTGVPAL